MNIPIEKWNHQGVVILWAPRSPCNLGCQYCYFGTLEDEINRTMLLQVGELNHIGRNDVPFDTILEFVDSFTPDLVHRVFISGGEPLLWRDIHQMISALRSVGSEVVVCTNGLPLVDERTSARLANAEVDAVSVSLDSYDPRYNDHWRVDRSGQGWHGVVKGIKTLLRKRREGNGQMMVGVYSVITRLNIDQILNSALFIAGLGVDYLIIQPVSLVKDHKLYNELSLDSHHYAALADAINMLMGAGLKIRLPNKVYLNLVLQTLIPNQLPTVRGCFGGRDLFFIEPDGSVWDCPSIYKIAETQPSQQLSIVGHSASGIFSTVKRGRNTDCSCFSQDCVNMWQLMAFDDILS